MHFANEFALNALRHLFPWPSRTFQLSFSNRIPNRLGFSFIFLKSSRGLQLSKFGKAFHYACRADDIHPGREIISKSLSVFLSGSELYTNELTILRPSPVTFGNYQLYRTSTKISSMM
jgi:hypothetical protein